MTMGFISTYVFETVQVLVALAANIALEGLLLLHTQSTGVRRARFWIDNREGTVAVLMQLLGRVSMGLVVPGSIVSGTFGRNAVGESGSMGWVDVGGRPKKISAADKQIPLQRKKKNTSGK